MRYHVTIRERTFTVDVEPEGLRVDDVPADASLEALGNTGVHGLILDRSSHRVVAGREGAGRWSLHVDGVRMESEVVDERTRTIREMAGALAGPTGPRPIRAPMPGLVVKLEVAVGDTVVPGQGLVIVEAMKMENELKAEVEARVVRILVAPGEAVDKDQVLVDLEALDEPEEEA